MQVMGAIVAGQFAENGSVVRKVGKIPEDLKESVQLCVQHNHASDEFFKSFNDQIPRQSGSLIAWNGRGSRNSVVVIGNRPVFAETNQIDYNQLMAGLAGSRRQVHGP